MGWKKTKNSPNEAEIVGSFGSQAKITIDSDTSGNISVQQHGRGNFTALEGNVTSNSAWGITMKSDSSEEIMRVNQRLSEWLDTAVPKEKYEIAMYPVAVLQNALNQKVETSAADAFKALVTVYQLDADFAQQLSGTLVSLEAGVPDAVRQAAAELYRA